MRLRCLIVFVFIALFIFSLQFNTAVFAQDHDDMEVEGAEVDMEKVDKAVEKAVSWLKIQQNANGSWVRAGSHEENFTGGVTAFTLLALLKGGVSPNDPAIRKGFDFCLNPTYSGQRRDGQMAGWERMTYSAACLILAIEAKYNFKPSKKDKEDDKSKKISTRTADEEARLNFNKKVTPQDRKILDELVAWLLGQQQANVWRYPGPAQDGNDEDASNTQYASLALNTARRLGYPIRADVWSKTADYFVKYQEEVGPEVEWFPVPGADFLIRDLKKMEKDILKQIAKAQKKSKKSADPESEDISTTSEVELPNPYEKFGVEEKKMFARGWGYIPKGKAGEYKDFEVVSMSMTTSGVVSLMVSKVGLEDNNAYSAKIQKNVDKSIRDGCAWIAHNFSVKDNPPKQGFFHYYTLYGLERVGVLTLTSAFGKHNWYAEGANYLLSSQSSNGSWKDQTSTDLVSTCFAILFLKKATTPIVEIPEQVYTGENLLPGKKDKDK
ncbi:MAG: prenyltransferase/squalene oxidase repeat-containing protein [Planctomycetota bacterium]